MTNAWIKKSLLRTGVLRLGSRLRGPGVAILMYHSVMDDPLSAQMTLGNIIHSTQVFREQMKLIARKFQAVSLDDVLSFLKGEKALPPRAVAITFDDGYADNYRVATEIMSPLGIPGIFYVTVDCIDRQRLPWPSLLRHAFLTSRKGSWTEPEGRIWPLSSNEERIQAFDRASEYCSALSGEPQDQFLDSTLQQLQTELPVSPTRLMMTWDEVRGLVRNGHTVGSHTMTHPNLAHLKESDALRELLEAKRRLDEQLPAPVVHFSYPCPALQPHWIDQTVRTSRQVGYQTAVTTDAGVVRRHNDPLTLRRVRPTKTVNGLAWNLECAFLGRAV
jgi:peptidoglycan/xylan/chitin deacetylase (PgdA/CDA1 family)